MIEMLMPYIIVTAIWVPLLLLRRWVDARHVRRARQAAMLDLDMRGR